MSTDQDVVVRVAVRAIVAAAIVGLLVLMFQGRAFAQSTEELAEQLATTEEENAPAQRAQELIREDRSQRWLRVHDRVLETGIRAWTSGSPRRLLSGARGLASELWSLQYRSPAEDRALEWLEVEIDPGTAPANDLSRDLYEQLRERELEDLVADRLDRARSALDDGYLTLASAQLLRATELDANSEEALTLLDRLERLQTSTEPRVEPLQALLDGPSDRCDDVSLFAALLEEDYARVQAGASTSSEDQYARAVAMYLGGDREAGLGLLEELGDGAGPVGTLARGWIDREDVNVEAVFEREARAYRIRHVLGLVGGRELAAEGTALSGDMVRAWRDSITPMNMALSVPARLFRGWRPDGGALREAALEYLNDLPAGLRAEEARAWLQTLSSAEPSSPSPASPATLSFSSEGGLHLPPARTAYERLSASPLLVSRGVLDSVYVSDAGVIRDSIGDAHAIVLEARRDVSDAMRLDPERASAFLSELSFALEQGKLDAHGPGLAATLEGIRRLDRAVRDGAVLTVEPADFGTTEVWGTVTRAYIDGEYETVGALSFSRGKDDLRATRQFTGGSVHCPERTLCVDRTHAVRSTLFARLDTDSKLQIALAGEIGGARMSISMIGSGGPHASLVLPVGKWLGVGSWLPVAAVVGISGDSVYVGPTFSH